MLVYLLLAGLAVTAAAVCAVLWRHPSRRIRRVMWGFTLTGLTAAALLAGGGILLSQFQLRYRPWVVTLLTGAAEGAVFLLTFGVVWAFLHWPQVKIAVKAAVTVSCVYVLLVGSLYALFLFAILASHREAVGTLQGRRVVEDASSWHHAIYSYYEYRGPLVMGPRLERSVDRPLKLEP